MSSETTFCYDNQLPQLPVPDFQGSLKRYLASVRVLVDDEQYAKTEALIEEFGKPGGLGEELHQVVVDRAKTTDNWLSDWWTEYVYLRSREPIVLGSSVVAVAGHEPVKTEDEYITLSAKAAISLVTYYWQIYHQTLPVYKAGKVPLCMIQWLRFFAGGRIPGFGIDDQKFQDLDDDISTHLIISHHNQFFTIEAIRDDKVISFAEMKWQIQRIIQRSTEVTEPVGMLTTENRETWAHAYQLLTQDPDNYQSWHTIHRGISVLSLETTKYECNVQPDHPDYQDELYSILTAGQLHGHGSKYNTGNRWNDKTVSYIVSGYGSHGMLGEHSSIDGITIFHFNSFMDQQVKEMDTNQCISQQELDQIEPPKKIEWKLNDELRQLVQNSAVRFDKSVANVCQHSMIFDNYGKDFVKSLGISPDSFIQMALQLIYYMLENKVPNQYEGCSYIRFKRGRTETIRSSTSKSKILCQVWTDPKSTFNEKKVAFVEAAQAHSQLAKEAVMGKAWDRIMFGMKIAALEKGLPQPEIFSDPSFQLMNELHLSTSQASFGPISNAIFAPSCHHGYGISYCIRPDRFNFAVSDFISCEKTSSRKFLKMLRQFFDDFKAQLIK